MEGRLFISGLPHNVKIDDVNSHFSKHGPIVNIGCKKDPNGSNFNVYILHYKSFSDAEAAYEKIKNETFDGRTLQVTIDKMISSPNHDSYIIQPKDVPPPLPINSEPQIRNIRPSYRNERPSRDTRSNNSILFNGLTTLLSHYRSFYNRNR